LFMSTAGSFGLDSVRSKAGKVPPSGQGPIEPGFVPCVYTCIRRREFGESWIKTVRRLLY
jgi:hypothetical protein